MAAGTLVKGVVGGQKLTATLAAISSKLTGKPELRVGFLEGSTEPDGTPTPYVAAINEFGATVHVPAGKVTIHRKINAKGDFLRGGRFVKKKQANFSSTHATPAHTITIPPRPFFRNMIAAKSPRWPEEIAAVLKAANYDTARTLLLMGERIKGQLQQSIHDTTSPPNAASTVRRKGFNKPLIDTGTMWRSVDYEVSTGHEGNS